VLNVVASEGETLPDQVRWLLTGSLATVMISIGLFIRLLDVPGPLVDGYGKASGILVLVGAIILVMGIVGAWLTPYILLVALLLLLLVPIIYEMYLRVLMSDWIGPLDGE
jgi:hypothetical protein